MHPYTLLGGCGSNPFGVVKIHILEDLVTSFGPYNRICLWYFYNVKIECF